MSKVLRLALVPLAALVLGAALIVFLAWPTLSQLVRWTGEEDPAAQMRGIVALAQIWLQERPLQLDPDRPLPYTSRSPYGVSVFLEQEADPAAVARSLDMIKAAGITTIRQQFPWADIEIHGKGDFEDRRNGPPRSAWAKYDTIMDMADARGLTVVARLDTPPAWSRADRAADETFGPPDNYEDYGDFVEAVVQRYKGRLRYVQIWNEPNIYPEWGLDAPDPEAYARLLDVAARRIRAVDPSIAIISAPLAPTLDHNDKAMYDLDYLEGMLQAGAAKNFDILGIIAYGLGSSPDDHRVVWHRTNFARPQILRDILVRNGAGDKPAWIMEMGWSAVPESLAAPFGRVSEAQQARYVVDAYRRIEDDYPWVGAAMLWFFRRPNDEWFNRPEGYFRLVNPDWTAQPAYTALAAAATAPPALHSGFQHIAAPGFHWQGPWRPVATKDALLGSWMQGSNGAEVSFLYDGTSATLVTREGPTTGSLDISVDGGAAQRVNLTAPTEARREISLAAHPLPGPHTVTLRVVGGEAVIEGVRVERNGEVWLRMGLLGLSALLAVLGVSYAAWRVWGVRHV